LALLRGLIATMRPKQWVKNILVYAGLVFDGQLFLPDSFLRVTFAMILLILMSGTVYIINDLVDVEKDRKHPKKRNRPIASGRFPESAARIFAVILPLITLAIAIVFDWRTAVILVLYLISQIAYSFWLKHVVILDVLTVTSGFVLRVIVGVVVIQVANFSPWLYACTAMLALFLAVGKRRQELVKLGEKAKETRPIFNYYNLPLLDDMLRIVTTGTLLTYLIYTIESDTVQIADVNLSMITVPFVMYALFYYLYLIHVKGEGGAPDEVLLKDRGLQTAILLWGFTFLILIYIPQG